MFIFTEKRKREESPAETGPSKRCNKAIKSLQDWPIRGLSTLRLLNYGQDAIVILWVSECIIGKDVYVFAFTQTGIDFLVIVKVMHFVKSKVMYFLSVH